MPNMKWSELTPLQLGQYGEYYAKMEFTSYMYDVYTSEVDDHGVDFVAKSPKNGVFYEIQVKSLQKGKYVCIPKDKLITDQNHLVCFLHFEDGKLPDVYVIPGDVWSQPNALFVDRKYDKPNQKSKPEWGINYSKKNIPLLEKYRAEKYFAGV